MEALALFAVLALAYGPRSAACTVFAVTVAYMALRAVYAALEFARRR